MADQRGRRDFRRPTKILEPEPWRRACGQTSRLAVDTSSGLSYNAPYETDGVLFTAAVATQEQAHEERSRSSTIDGRVDHLLASLYPFPAEAPTPHPRLITFRAEGIGAGYNQRRARKSPTGSRGSWPIHAMWSALPACRLSMEYNIGYKDIRAPINCI